MLSQVNEQHSIPVLESALLHMRKIHDRIHSLFWAQIPVKYLEMHKHAIAQIVRPPHLHTAVALF